MSQDLSVEIVGHVMVATIDRAEAHNSIGGTLFRDLLEASWACEQDEELAAFVLTARGRNWCAGGDVSALQTGFGPGARASRLVHRGGLGGETGLPPIPDAEITLDRLGIGAWAPLYLRTKKPLIAAINGAAVGGGFALALLHDFRIASEAATLIPAFASLGVGPELGTSWFLPRIVGLPNATRILLSNQRLDAGEALSVGLVNEVVPPDELRGRAIELGESFAGYPRDAVRATLLALRASPSATLRQQLEREALLSAALASNPG